MRDPDAKAVTNSKMVREMRARRAARAAAVPPKVSPRLAEGLRPVLPSSGEPASQSPTP